MTELIICGQAPSRVGDGRAFSGPSGRRLANLFGLRDYEELASMYTLTNIFDVPAVRRPLPARRSSKHRSIGDEFDERLALDRGYEMTLDWVNMEEAPVVLACGAKVAKALIGRPVPMYKGKRLGERLDVWHFPHPSGASQYWNSPDHVEVAARFLKRLLERYGLAGA